MNTAEALTVILGLVGIVILFFVITCFAWVLCPYCGKKFAASRGTFDYSDSFNCPYCKRKIENKGFVSARKNDTQEHSDN